MAHGDNPIAQVGDDHLDRSPAVRALVTLLRERHLDTPLAIGVYGAWGSGKTSVMNLIKVELESEAQDVIIDFAAWRYSHYEDALWRAMLLSLIAALREKTRRRKLASFKVGKEATAEDVEAESAAINERLGRLSDRLYRSLSWTEKGNLRIKWEALIPVALRTVSGFVPGGKAGADALLESLMDKEKFDEMTSVIESNSKERFEDQVTSLEQFRAEFEQLVGDYFISQPIGGRPRRLYVFVDDLDRCLPEDGVNALEAIKTFLDVPGVVFVLGMDRRVVEQGIRVRYADLADGTGKTPIDAAQYLDKIVQIPFTLPPLGADQIYRFVSKWCDAHDEDSLKKHCRDLIVVGVAPNPRLVKRTLNLVRLLRLIRTSYAPKGHKPNMAELQRLTVLAVLQTSYEQRFEHAVRSPVELKNLEKKAVLKSLNAEGDEASLHEMFSGLKQAGAAFAAMGDTELGSLLQLTRLSA